MVDAVALGHLNLPHHRLVYEGAELGQGLLAAACYTDQQSVASGELEDSADPQYVLHTVLEEDQVEFGYSFAIIVVLFFIQNLGDFLEFSKHFILFGL